MTDSSDRNVTPLTIPKMATVHDGSEKIAVANDRFVPIGPTEANGVIGGSFNT